MDDLLGVSLSLVKIPPIIGSQVTENPFRLSRNTPELDRKRFKEGIEERKLFLADHQIVDTEAREPQVQSPSTNFKTSLNLQRTSYFPSIKNPLKKKTFLSNIPQIRPKIYKTPQT